MRLHRRLFLALLGELLLFLELRVDHVVMPASGTDSGAGGFPLALLGRFVGALVENFGDLVAFGLELIEGGLDTVLVPFAYSFAQIRDLLFSYSSQLLRDLLAGLPHDLLSLVSEAICLVLEFDRLLSL